MLFCLSPGSSSTLLGAMGRSLRSDQERAEAAQKRCIALAVKADTNKCVNIIMSNPSVLPAAIKLFRTMGLWGGSTGGAANSEGPSPPAEAVHAVAPALAAPAAASDTTKDEEESPSKAEGQVPLTRNKKDMVPPSIHRNCVVWSMVGTNVLKYILSRCQPIVCSIGNLKSLCTAGSREVPKAPLLDLLESYSGKDGCSIVCEERDTVKVGDEMAQLHADRGGFGYDMMIPRIGRLRADTASKFMCRNLS